MIDFGELIFLENPADALGLETHERDMWLVLPGLIGSPGRSWTTLLNPEVLFFTNDISTQGWGREFAPEADFLFQITGGAGFLTPGIVQGPILAACSASCPGMKTSAPKVFLRLKILRAS